MDAAISLIAHYIRDTRSLLRLRAVCKQARDCLPMESIVGMEMVRARRIWNGTSWYAPAFCIEYCAMVGTAMTDGGSHFWTWTYSEPMQLTRFDCKTSSSKAEFRTTYSVRCESGCLLWLHALGNDHVCTLSVVDESEPEDGAVILMVLKIAEPELKEIKRIELDPRRVLRKPVFGDENTADLFAHNRVFYAFNALFIMGRDALGVVAELVVGAGVESVTWYEGLKMDIACQTESFVYMANAKLGNIYRIDPMMLIPFVCAKITPRNACVQKIFGMINNKEEVSDFRVSCSEKSYVMYYRESEELVHYDSNQKVWTVLERRIHFQNISFIGEDAIVCILQNVREFRIYNIVTKCIVRRFMTPHVARASVLTQDVYWTVGFSMSINHIYHGLFSSPGHNSVENTFTCNEGFIVSLI